MAVIVVGSINLDLIARMDKIPSPGETRLAEGLEVSPGGKGANQALASRRMGAPTTFLGTVGGDAFARQATALLRQDGVDLTYLDSHAELSTGIAMISVDHTGQNTIIVADGANRATQETALSHLDRLLKADDWVVVQNEIPLATTERAIWIAHQHHAQAIWDPAPALADAPRGLFAADIVIPNQGEAEVLLGTTIDDVRSAKAGARLLRDRGAAAGIVKLGGEGVVWATVHGVFYLPAVSLSAVDTVGAGDVFAGALAARLDHGDSLADAMAWANLAAGLSTTKAGAQPSFPTWENVRQYAYQQLSSTKSTNKER
jgi:ribokinase